MPVTWGMEDFSKRVEAATNGRLIMKAHPAGAICPATEEHKAIQTGVLDWAGSGGGYMRGDMPWAGQLIQPVGGMPPEPLQIWLDNEGCGIANKWFETLGWDFTFVKGSGFAGPPEIFGHFQKELNTVADLEGIKMRCSGDGGTVLGNMGVGPIFMPLGEVFEAMQRGVIDAYECSSPRFDWEMGLNEVGKYVYLCPIRAPTEVYMFLIKTSTFNELPDHLKVIIEDLAVAETWDYHDKLVAGDAEALQKFRDYGNVVQPLPQNIVEAFGAEAVKYVDSEMAKDEGYKEVAQSQRAFAKSFNDLYGLPEWAKYSF
jgi:TRAP-type mannitol/chloroaromatic compound transport system substrate-binding protein